MCDEYGVGLNECKLICAVYQKWEKSYHLLYISDVANPLKIPYKQIFTLCSSEGRCSISGKMFSREDAHQLLLQGLKAYEE
jgi:hypothetical protein